MPSGLGLTVQVWSSTDLRPLGQPVVAAGVPVGLVTEGRKLFLIGIDPATGRQLWKQEASPSAVTPGIPVSVDVIGDRVVYFRPDAAGELYARLVVADPKTGNDLVASGPQLFVSRPTACSRRPDDRDVCTVATASRSQTPRSHRLKVDTGQYVAEDTTVAAYTRSIGDGGLVDLGPRGPEYLAMIRDGNVAWRTPVTQAFPSGFSTDHGWNWRYRSEEHAFIGSIYGPTTQLPDGSRRRDLASGAAMAALSETDGSVLWRDNGSSIDCDGTVSVSVPVRCRYRGSATYRTDRPASYEGLDVTIEGYDRRSGATTWSAPVGAVDVLVGGASTGLLTAGETQVVVPVPAGPVVIDLSTGTRQAAAANAVFWCASARREFEYETPFVYQDGRTVTTRSGGTVAFTCDAQAKPATGLPSASATKRIGANAGQFVVVASATGYTGYRIG